MKYRSTLFDQARNKIGSIVASENRNGNYFREKVIPRNPKSEKQIAVRAAFTANSQDWRTLSDADRAGWTSLSKQITLHDALGNKYNPTGQQLFVSNNSNLVLIGDSKITTPPGTIDPIPELSNIQLTATILTAAPHTHSLMLYGTTTDPTGDIALYFTPQFSAGRTFVGISQYRYADDLSGLNQTGVELISVYENQFGPLALGSKLAVRLKAITANGFASADQVVITTVTAD